MIYVTDEEISILMRWKRRSDMFILPRMAAEAILHVWQGADPAIAAKLTGRTLRTVHGWLADRRRRRLASVVTGYVGHLLELDENDPGRRGPVPTKSADLLLGEVREPLLDLHLCRAPGGLVSRRRPDAADPRRLGRRDRTVGPGRQCLDRRIDTLERLNTELAACQEATNQNQRQASWHFATSDARVKLRHLYPAT